MKKTVLLAVCLCLLAGCTVTPSPAPPLEPRVSIHSDSATVTAEDGTELLRISTPTIILILSDWDAAEAINKDLLGRVEQRMAGASELESYAKSEYPSQDNWALWTCELQAQAMRLDEKVLSIYFEYSEFTGGNHPSVFVDALTYDCQTGQVLALAELLAEGHSLMDFAPLVNEALASSEDLLYDDYEALVSKAFADGDIPSWYLSDEGLCFAFDPYAIGPYASGIITATLSYEKLGRILRPGYL